MVDNKIPTFDMTKLEDVAQLLPHAPLLTSHQVFWTDLFLSYYRHPAYDSQECCMRQHMLVIDAGTSVNVRRRLDGKLEHYQRSYGDITFCPANVSIGTAWEKTTNFILLILNPVLIERVAHESIDADVIELIPHSQLADPVILQIAFALKEDLDAGCPAGRIYGESFGAALAVHLVKKCSVFEQKIQEYANGLPKRQLQVAIDYIQAYLDQNIKLADLAQAVGMSQYYFCRLFKQSMGITPHQYLVRQRVEKAKHLLLQKELSIAEVALQVGFTHQSHLNRHFKRLLGITPKKILQK